MLYIFCFLFLVGIVYGECPNTIESSDLQIVECSVCISIPCEFRAKIYVDNEYKSVGTVKCTFDADTATPEDMTVADDLNIAYYITPSTLSGLHMIRCLVENQSHIQLSITLGIYQK